MKHGFVKVAAASPEIRLADPAYNAQVLADTAREAHEANGVRIIAFPELCLTGATCGARARAPAGAPPLPGSLALSPKAAVLISKYTTVYQARTLGPDCLSSNPPDTPRAQDLGELVNFSVPPYLFRKTAKMVMHSACFIVHSEHSMSQSGRSTYK